MADNNEVMEWRLVSANGNLIKKQHVGSAHSFQINTANMAVGSYVLQLSSNKFTQAFKIIIK
jgi:hypothetical protein